jgi:hypothetical protein
MTNNKEELRQLILEQKRIQVKSIDLGAQKKAIAQIQKLEARLGALENGQDPSNSMGRWGVLALGLAAAPFTGGTSLVMAGLTVGCDVVGEGITGKSGYTYGAVQEEEVAAQPVESTTQTARTSRDPLAYYQQRAEASDDAQTQLDLF